jgi:hypothetical protein
MDGGRDPQLMQRICLDVCFDFGIRHEKAFTDASLLQGCAH